MKPSVGKRYCSHCAAFTLIELLVVIAIIALLVSILLPSLEKAKSLAKQVVCKTQLRNILTGVNIYTQDYDGALYHAGQTSTLLSQYGYNYPYDYLAWNAALLPYMSEAQIFVCPALDRNETRCVFNGYPQLRKSYGGNGMIYDQDSLNGYGGALSGGVNIKDITSPQRLFMAVDGYGSDLYIELHGQFGNTQAYPYNLRIRPEHHNTANAGFLDTHVEELDGNGVGLEMENIDPRENM